MWTFPLTQAQDPAIVGSPNFGKIWSANIPGNFNGLGKEQIFASPLVYTIGDTQYVFIATTQNNIYKLNAKTGAIVAQRNLHVPFLTAELEGCVDINPTIGITATGVIDPSTGLWYLTAKTYAPQFQDGNFSPSKPPGRLNGRYYFHAINTADLSEAAGFPTLVDGTVFRNNPRRMFIGGNQHQRPALLQVGDYIYTGWASHCIQYNYTGAIIGFHRTTGAIVEAFATEGGPAANTVPGGGVWMSGGGLAYDGAGSMFFSTGNGYASELPANGRPVQGRNPPTSLEEAVVNMKINSDGTIQPVDFFMPWEKTQLDGADKDLGTTPFQLLPSDTFTCPNSRRIGMVTGKSGKTYWLNTDNLGGYQMGENRLDAAIQVTENENSVYAGAGVNPLGGGYVYVPVTTFQTHVFKFSCNAAGNAVFTKVADTPEKNAGILGTGHGTITSLNGQDGSALLWTTDREGQNLRIYDAMPKDGKLTLLKSFNFPNVAKFAKISFGNGIAYVPTLEGVLHAFGSPVSLPLNCSSPYTFPNTPTGNTSDPLTVKCTANVQTTLTALNVVGNPNFRIDSLPAMPLLLNANDVFTFKAYFAPKTVGLLSSDVVADTSNAVTGFSANTPITLKGTANSAAPVLSISPGQVSFQTTIGSGPSSSSAFLLNSGDMMLKVKNVSYSLVSEKGPFVTPNTTSDGSAQVGPFTFSGVPSTIAANGQATIGITYNATNAGNQAVYATVFSDGGNKILNVFGTAGSAPGQLVEFQSPDGSSWIPYTGQNFSFGDVQEGTTRNLILRITNNGSSTASPLKLTVSKAPYGVPGIVGAANNIDLAEGTIIGAGQSQNATLYCAALERQVNTPTEQGHAQWTINTNTDSGKFFLQFNCNSIAPQVGPLLANGTSQYAYAGCFRDLTPGRQLATNIYTDDNNSIERCTGSCYQAGWTFAGTSYRSECWCGNAIPTTLDDDSACNFRCSGAQNETCGGDDNQGRAQLSVFGDRLKFNGNTTSPILAITQQSGSYSYAGCYKETGGKTFNSKTMNSRSLTVDSCMSFCAGYSLFGLQYSSECYCGSTIASSSSLTNDTDCNMSCSGNNSQYCGAGSRMQVYRLNGTISSSTSSSGIQSSTSSTGITSVTTASNTITTISSSTVAVESTAPTDVSCPASNGTTVTSGGKKFLIECGIDHVGGDLTSLNVNSFAACIDACAQNAQCVDVALSGAACYLKSTLGAAVNNGVWGAKLVELVSSPTSGSVSSISATSSSLSVSSSVTSTSSASLSSNSESSTSSPSTSPDRTTSTSTVISTSTTSSTSATATPPICPGSNSTTYISNGVTFLIECGIDHQGGDMSSLAVNSFQQCIDVCAKTNGCINVALSGAACYLKNMVGAAVYNGVFGARVVSDPSMTSSVVSLSTTLRSSSSSSSNSSVASSTAKGSDSSSSMSIGSTTVSSTSNGSTISATTTSSSVPSTSTSNSISSTLSSSTGATASSSPSTSSATPTISTSSSATRTTLSTSTTTSSSSSITSIAPSAPTQVGTFRYVGCYTEVNGRAINQKSANNNNMTNENCASFCSGYQYFATEYATECYCGSSLSTSSKPATDGRCNMPCAGDKTEICGGPNGLTLYAVPSNSSAPPSPTIVVPSSSNYIAQGCFNEKPNNGRALSNVYYDPTNSLTIPACAAQAQKRNATWFGVEFGGECFYGNTFDNASHPIRQSACDMSCPGNSTTWCGGADALQMYRLPLACPADNGTLWNSYNGTARFQVRCSMDYRAGGTASRVAADTFEQCLNGCAMDMSCRGVSYRETDCYMMSALGNGTSDSAMLGATVVQRQDNVNNGS